jgi:uncharacterized membrane protein YoaK (UPF0700 family)
MLLVLTWAAGSVDALSYLGLGNVFTAMMTGNTVLLGLAVAQGQALAALRSVLALVGFCAGVAAGALIVQRSRPRQDWPPAVTAALGVEGVILGIFTAIWQLTAAPRSPGVVHVLIVLSGFAMGIQSAGVQRLGVSGVTTTYITGTLTSLMVDLVAWLRPPQVPSATTPAVGADAHASPATPWPHRVSLLAAVFITYGFGALVGGLLQARTSFASLAPLGAVTVVAVNAAVRQRHR